MARMLITGAAGMGATAARPLLRARGHDLVLLDIAEIGEVDAARETAIRGSVTDPDILRSALSGVDVVVHLGGISTERPWSDILHANIDGTQKLLEAAQAAGVIRVLLASSTHAVGFWPASTDAGLLTPRPDTYYGMSKVAVEALGSLFADRFGMTVVSARIGTFADAPEGERHRRTWLSYPDLVRLIEAVADTVATGHHVVYGISANTRRWFPLEPGFAIGYRPQDDAEMWGPFDDGESPDDGPIGGGMASATYPLGGGA